MTRVAFYAPMKPIDHPTPSGDRRMARLFMQAIEIAGYSVDNASSLRTYDGAGDASVQATLVEQAKGEADRLTMAWRADPPDIWFTYHCYYKAPDLIGPSVARHFDIPYVIAEASRAKKRFDGPWHFFAGHAEAAIDAAQVLLAMTAHDRFALDRDARLGQRVIDFPPFIDAGETPRAKPRSSGVKLLTVAMMREGDKLDSYRQLAAALPFVKDDWALTIIGDGPAREQVAALFEPFGEKVDFRGAVDESELRAYYENNDVLIWPGVNEAYGMVYLEAQAAGMPVVAQDWPGPCAVIGSGSLTVPRDELEALADAITTVAGDINAGQAARAHILAEHTLDTAARRLAVILGEIR